MKSFTDYIQNSSKEITIVIEPFTVPTNKHGDVFETARKTALESQYRIYPLHSGYDLLEYTQKVKYIRKMFPRHARSIILSENKHNIFDVLQSIYSENFSILNLVCEQDKVAEYDTLANKYNGVKGRGGFYKFHGGVNVISSGILSESLMEDKMLMAVKQNDFQTFSKGLPSGFKEGKELFNDIRKGMGLTESHDFRSHIQLHPVSEDREAYVAGNLFSTGDFVIITATEEMGTISFLGTNYVIVETFEGKKYRKWISDVERLDEGDNLDRVQQEKQDALDKLDQEYERKIERAKQADETQAEQEKRRQEVEDEAEDDSENQNESVKTFIQYLEQKCEMISYNDIKELEKVFSKKFDDFDIDFRFTRHFSDRVSDDRNNPCITTKELKSLFNRLYMSKRQGRNIFSRWPDMEIVMKDVRNNINIPFAIEYDKSTDEFEVIAKTIMRKKNFKSSGPIVKV